MSYACWECGKKIRKGEVVHHVPAKIAIMIGADFEKAFHPSCHLKWLRAASEEWSRIASEAGGTGELEV